MGILIETKWMVWLACFSYFPQCINFIGWWSWFFFQLDKEIKETWDAAADAGYFTYRLDHVEGRVAPGKYSLLIQVINPPIKYNITNIYFSFILIENWKCVVLIWNGYSDLCMLWWLVSWSATTIFKGWIIMQLLQLQLNVICNILNEASMNSDKVLIYPTIIV